MRLYEGGAVYGVAFGPITEVSSIVITADELGVHLNLACCQVALTPDAGLTLAGDAAEAVASSRALARAASAGREAAALAHADRMVAECLPDVVMGGGAA